MPNASNVNYVAGDTVPNAVVAKLGAGGKVCVFSYAATDLIVDVNGTFPAGSSFSALTPARLLETRSGPGIATVDGAQLGAGPVAAGSVTQVQVAGRGGVPADASAVVLNVTATQAQAPGFFTVFPCGAPVPNASNVNYVAGDTVPNAVVAKLGAGGKVCVFSYAATDLIVDVNGTFPAGSSFSALTPARLLETRSGPGIATVDGAQLGAGPVAAGSVTQVQVAGRGGVPADASAVVLNVTATQAQAPGFFTVFPCGAPVPNASNVNYVAGDTVPNAVVAKLGAGGKVCVFSYAATDLIVDVNGTFPG